MSSLAREQQLLPDTGHFIRLTHTTKEVHVSGRLPRAEARHARVQAVQPFSPWTQFRRVRIRMEWQIFAFFSP